MNQKEVVREFMDVFEAIKNRRSIRKYQPRDVSDETVRLLIDAARWAPSGHNIQFYGFIIIRNKETKEQIRQFAASHWREANEHRTLEEIKWSFRRVAKEYQTDEAAKRFKSGEWFDFITEAPVLIAVVGRPNSPDACMATENLMLAAYAMGLGSISTTSATMKPENERTIARMLNVPENLKVIFIVPIGYPAEKPVIEKRSLEELMHYERWHKVQEIEDALAKR